MGIKTLGSQNIFVDCNPCARYLQKEQNMTLETTLEEIRIINEKKAAYSNRFDQIKSSNNINLLNGGRTGQLNLNSNPVLRNVGNVSALWNLINLHHFLFFLKIN